MTRTATLTVTALDLYPGLRVRDNFTAWAEVVSVTAAHGGRAVVVSWLLADGKRETCRYAVADTFTPITH